MVAFVGTRIDDIVEQYTVAYQIKIAHKRAFLVAGFGRCAGVWGVVCSV